MRRILLIIIAIAITAAAVFYVDFTTLWEAVTGLSTISLILLFVFLLTAAVLRSLRWAYYLKAAQLNLSWWDAMKTYLAGMAAGAVPGGSFLPARLAQEHGGTRMRQAAAALFVAFVGDTIALAVLAAIAITILSEPPNRYVIPGAALILATMLITMGRSERVWMAVARFLLRFRLTRNLLPKEADIHEKVAVLMQPRIIAGGVALSSATTAVSMAILYLLVNGLTFRGISVSEAIYVHAFSESAATVIPSPGGIGVIDSSMAGLLNSLSIGWIRATFIVLTIRSVDLLFKTIVGSVLLVVFYHRLLRSMLQLRRRARGARRRLAVLWGSRLRRPRQTRSHRPEQAHAVEVTQPAATAGAADRLPRDNHQTVALTRQPAGPPAGSTGPD